MCPRIPLASFRSSIRNHGVALARAAAHPLLDGRKIPAVKTDPARRSPSPFNHGSFIIFVFRRRAVRRLAQLRRPRRTALPLRYCPQYRYDGNISTALSYGRLVRTDIQDGRELMWGAGLMRRFRIC